MPMGKAIRTLLFKIIVLCLVFGFSSSNGFSQVSVTDVQAFGISFDMDETRTERNAIRLSVNDLSNESASVLPGVDIQRFPSGRNSSEGYYFVQTQGQTAVGSYYNNSTTGELFHLPLKNATSDYIESVSVAFDFVFKPIQRPSDIVFQLSYRVNNEEWKEPGGGRFTSEYLQAESDDWSTFTMQIMLNDLFLLPDDKFELRWTALAAGENQDFIPVALQNVELFPEQARDKKLRPGELIISELLPVSGHENGSAEYIELYNSTEHKINLKGLYLFAGYDQIVVQRDLWAAPYSAVVLANSGGNRTLDEAADYTYRGRLLGESSGEVKLNLYGYEVARGLYDAAEQGRALRMDHLENAFDGYSGLSHFIQESSEFSNGLYGSPGEIETESRIFSKTFDQPGWHLFQPPGHLSSSLNHDLRNELLPFNKNNESETTEDGGNTKLYLLRVTDESAGERVFASGSASYEDEKKLKIPGLDLFTPLPLSLTHTVALEDVQDQNDRQAFPAILTWNAEKQNFDLVWKEGDRLEPWDAYIVPEHSNPDIQLNSAENDRQEGAWTGLNRWVELTLTDGEQTEENIRHDRAVIGFWDGLEGNDDPYSLPKIWSPLEENSRESRSPFIYLKSGDEKHGARSYINAPYTPDQLLEFPLEVKMPEGSGRMRILWGDLEALPDRWELEFVDTELDERINMRLESGYSFTDRSEKEDGQMTDPDLSFTPVETTESTRFYLRISSDGDLGAFDEETETADSVKLKQNYPNPFNPTTTIGFYLPKSTEVRIGVYNVVGQQVGQLIDERLSAGDHTVTWNASDLPSGVYIVQMEASGSVNTRKITLIK